MTRKERMAIVELLKANDDKIHEAFEEREKIIEDLPIEEVNKIHDLLFKDGKPHWTF